MTNIEVPSDDAVVAALVQIGGTGTARELCQALVADGHPARQSQLAIQRAAERGRVQVNSDWSLSLVHEAVAA